MDVTRSLIKTISNSKYAKPYLYLTAVSISLYISPHIRCIVLCGVGYHASTRRLG
jgi:hypothetical protein